MLETDPAVCTHAMGVCVHAVERCVRVCVVHGGGAGSLLSPPGLSGAGGCWQGLVGGGVTGDGAGCRDAGLSPPTCPPPTLKPQAPHPAQPLSPPLPWAGGGGGVLCPSPGRCQCSLPAAAQPRCRGRAARPWGRAPAQGPARGRGGQQWGWERGNSSCVPIPQGTPAAPPPPGSLPGLRAATAAPGCPRSRLMDQLQPPPP